MDWVVLSYSLPSQARSSPRVAIWRRLRRLGAVSPTGSLYILPAEGTCIEAFQWLAQEIRQSEGQAVLIETDRIEGITEQQIITMFQTTRKDEYARLESQAGILEQAIGTSPDPENRDRQREALGKLQKQFTDIIRIDYFKCPEGVRTGALLEKLAKMLSLETASDPDVTPLSRDAFTNKTWVTRPHPHVDRLACIWLIRRYIDPGAIIRYTLDAQPGEITFDMNDAVFGHIGNLCTFETMIRAFELENPELSAMAEIVHEIDLHDGRYYHPESDGIDMILQGWLLLDLSDDIIEKQGTALFDGLHHALAARFQK